MRSLKKITEGNFFGVCAGIAYWLRMPTWFVRFVVILAYLYWSGAIFFPYIILALILPEWPETPEDYERVSG